MKAKMLSLILLTVSAGAAHVFADADVTSSLRRVDLVNAPTPSTTKSTTATSGVFNDSVADSGGSSDTATSGSADQNTDIQPLVFGGSGSAAIVRHTESPSIVLAGSSVLIYFTTSTFHDWSLGGSLSAETNGGYAYTTLQNLDTLAYVFSKETTVGNPSVNLADSGLLVPGHYQFYMEAQASGINGGDVDTSAEFQNAFFTLTPTDTPEPTSLGLLAIGSGIFLLRRRKYH
jgi:hypothetical protein